MISRKGYNLIEVLIAMALLAWVVLVIVGLFAYGQRGVYSGKTQTRAVVICQKVYEDIKNLPNYEQKYQVFGASIGQSSHTMTFYLGPTPPRTTNPFPAGDVLYTVFESWMAALDDLSPSATMVAVLTPKIAGDAGPTATIGNNIFIEYRIQVNWIEGLRNRHVTVDFSI